jgi:uncharacterized SAM-binding protein YcdF (DUF218 family)
MSFAIKQAISLWLMPLPVCLILIVTGAALAWWAKSPRLSRIGRLAGAAGALLLALFSNRLFARVVATRLEGTFPPVPDLSITAPVPEALSRCQYISVLGGGHTDSENFSANNKLNSSALERIIEGVRLARALPGAKLIVSGIGVENGPSNAEIMAQVAVGLGIDANRIIRLGTPVDTIEESEQVKRVVGDAPFALVTSAWHMPRAVTLMRHAGMHPLPCPTDYLIRPVNRASAGMFLWDSHSLDVTTAVTHEKIGYLWSWLRGRA